MPTIALARPALPALAGASLPALGTFCSLLVTAPDALAAARQILTGQLAAIDRACSRFRPDSELSALNASGGKRLEISPLFARALATAILAAEITDGDVDPTCGAALQRLGYDKDFAELASDTSALTTSPVPSPGWECVELDATRLRVRIPPGVVLDLGATAKALAADLAAGAIFARVGCGVLVNLGGDIATAGQPPPGGWRIGIDDGVPWRTARPCVTVQSGGVATSCPGVRRWRRGSQDMHHIVVPGTGRSAEVYWASVSVAAATCVDANIASTASIIRGRRAPRWLQQLNVPARLIRPDGAVVTTAGWPR